MRNLAVHNPPARPNLGHARPNLGVANPNLAVHNPNWPGLPGQFGLGQPKFGSCTAKFGLGHPKFGRIEMKFGRTFRISPQKWLSLMEITPPSKKKTFFLRDPPPQEPFFYGKRPFFSKKGLLMDQEPKRVFSRVGTRGFHKMREDMRNFKNLTGV